MNSITEMCLTPGNKMAHKAPQTGGRKRENEREKGEGGRGGEQASAHARRNARIYAMGACAAGVKCHLVTYTPPLPSSTARVALGDVEDCLGRQENLYPIPYLNS